LIRQNSKRDFNKWGWNRAKIPSMSFFFFLFHFFSQWHYISSFSDTPFLSMICISDSRTHFWDNCQKLIGKMFSKGVSSGQRMFNHISIFLICIVLIIFPLRTAYLSVFGNNLRNVIMSDGTFTRKWEDIYLSSE